MTIKFQNKFRIESIRLKDWDYRNNGAYFITICTKNRIPFFGKIIDEKMELNEIGSFANNFWLEIPNHFPFVELGNFQIMPNHIHGILIINKTVDVLQCNISMEINEIIETKPFDNNPFDTLQCNASTVENKNTFLSKISPKSGSISTIIRSYKSVVSKNSRSKNSNFEWQSGFYDHIIRNSKSFENIQNYIENNPANWKEDKFYN